MTKSPNDVKKAYLKIVPYYVTKNPSEPSLITSAISYIAFGPESFLRISTNIQILIPKNTTEAMKAVNEIMFEVVDDMNK